jgi:hypothetical protein
MVSVSWRNRTKHAGGEIANPRFLSSLAIRIWRESGVLHWLVCSNYPRLIA